MSLVRFLISFSFSNVLMKLVLTALAQAEQSLYHIEFRLDFNYDQSVSVFSTTLTLANPHVVLCLF